MNKQTLNRLLDVDCFSHKDLIKIRKLINYNFYYDVNGLIKVDVSLKNSNMGRTYNLTTTSDNLEEVKTRMYKDICMMLINDKSSKNLIDKESADKIIKELELVKIKYERMVATVFFYFNEELYVLKRQSPLALDYVKTTSLINALKMEE